MMRIRIRLNLFRLTLLLPQLAMRDPQRREAPGTETEPMKKNYLTSSNDPYDPYDQVPRYLLNHSDGQSMCLHVMNRDDRNIVLLSQVLCVVRAHSTEIE